MKENARLLDPRFTPHPKDPFGRLCSSGMVVHPLAALRSPTDDSFFPYCYPSSLIPSYFQSDFNRQKSDPFATEHGTFSFPVVVPL